MGAQRWIDLGIIQLQPSQLMNVTLCLALARYFHGLGNQDTVKIRQLIVPLLMILLPAALVLKQPDLGTAVMLLMEGTVLVFLAGVRLRVFAIMGILAAGAIPLVWKVLRDYQKNSHLYLSRS